MVDYRSSSKLQGRQSGISKLATHLNTPIESILASYKDSLFRDSTISKENVFREALALNLSKESEELIATRCNLPFHKDARTSVEYGLDLIFGWLSEDLILEVLKTKGMQIKLSGEDKHREFLTAREIGTAADYLIEVNGKVRTMEIVISWNGHWQNTDTWDLRDSKFRKLTLPGKESLVLGIEPSTLKGFAVDMAIIKDKFVNRPNPAWGGKPVYTLGEICDYLGTVELTLSSIT